VYDQLYQELALANTIKTSGEDLGFGSLVVEGLEAEGVGPFQYWTMLALEQGHCSLDYQRCRSWVVPNWRASGTYRPGKLGQAQVQVYTVKLQPRCFRAHRSPNSRLFSRASPPAAGGENRGRCSGFERERPPTRSLILPPIESGPSGRRASQPVLPVS
jgi:hypothetical protein